MAESIPTALTGTEESLVEKIYLALEQGEDQAFRALIESTHHSDMAEAVDVLASEEAIEVVRHLFTIDLPYCAEMLIDMAPASLSNLFEAFTTREWASILRELSDDDVVYLLEIFPEEAHKDLVQLMTRQEKQDVLQLMNYPEDSAGRLMTCEFLSVDHLETVEAVTEKVRHAKDLDPINLMFVYVTKGKELVGMVSLRQLLLAKKSTPVSQIMRTDMTPIDVNMDQEAVAEIVTKHDDVTVPVLNDEGHILGIITVDDVIDVINEESEEDLYLQIGSSEEEAKFRDNTGKIVLLRLPWILASFFGSLLVVIIMRISEQEIFGDNAAEIFTFVPMISAMGGNVGVQSSTIMARYLSSTSVEWSEARRTTINEAKVGLSLGFICGIMIGLIAAFWGGISLLLTVLVSMTCTLTAAAITGTVIPVLMKKRGFDPALATGPFVTSFNDFIAVCVYFSIVYLFMNHTVI